MDPKVSILIQNWNGWKEMDDEWMWRAKGKRRKANG
ncbi:hypothetical protein ES705_07314 [subsurface metagenome]